MSILKPESSSEDAPHPTTSATTAALLPLAATVPALTAVFHDRFGVAASVALVVVSLALVAAAGALVARAAAQAGAARARRDTEVLDALEPLAGARR
ncbi:hypothetical protein ACGFZK_02850 [Streptomyces sp. NPDC048257]|uniref:hypothetical protein n=1 Tax=Streptomyces sp. NPDC048257 TaxID=3365526 RepID=UPI00371506E4